VIRRTILEWESIAYGTSEGTIPQAVADRIAAVATASPLAGQSGGGVLEHGRKALRARGVIGVIAAENCALEILPKIDMPGETDATAPTGGIRKRLIHMLAVALDLQIEAGDITDHDYQRETLLELLIRLFSAKLADAVRQGMPRRYLVYADDLLALRGRLNVKRQFTILAASPQKLACRYGALSDDIALNRIMEAAVTRLGRIARSVDNQHRLRELAFAYAEVSDVPLAMLRWDTVVIDRTNARWRQLLNLAKLLLGERFQTTSDGSGSGFSLLFQMNTLFEEYVARMLARALAETGRKVVVQGGRLYCLETGAGRRLFQTKPDILVKRNGVVEQIIDTKWKRIARRIDDPKQGVAQADIYQMMAYGRLYRCPRLMLLYPHHQALGEAALKVTHRITIDNCDDRIKLATIDVGAGKGMIDRLRELCPEIDPIWPQDGLS
jgi:5-methylcytosine-specific restriction enzyme subunit McrC